MLSSLSFFLSRFWSGKGLAEICSVFIRLSGVVYSYLFSDLKGGLSCNLYFFSFFLKKMSS